MARRKVTRGWVPDNPNGENEVLAVDNVVNKSFVLLSGADVDSAGPIVDEIPEYLIRRVILDVNIIAAPAVLNLSGGVFVNAALVVVDDSRFNEDLVNQPLDDATALALWMERCARVLQVWVGMWIPAAPAATDFTAFTTPTNPGVPGQFVHRADLRWRGGINVRVGQSLRYVVGQSVAMIPNITGDGYEFNGVSRVLLQERRKP